MPEENVYVDFKHMDIPTLEGLVGKKAVDVRVKGRWVECAFAGKPGEAGITVTFKKW